MFDFDRNNSGQFILRVILPMFLVFVVGGGMFLAVLMALFDVPTGSQGKDSTSVDTIMVVDTVVSCVPYESIDSLIVNMSENKGHLNEAGKKRLEEMLKETPDNYWLKTIKKKNE